MAIGCLPALHTATTTIKKQKSVGFKPRAFFIPLKKDAFKKGILLILLFFCNGNA